MLKNTRNSFSSDVVNLETLSELSFTIPTYQRPFVWEDEHLRKLLDDFYKSFKEDPGSSYYISTFLTKDDNNLAELIDGQQRFTSLWLIAFAISKISPDSDIVRFLKKENEMRLGFEIRKEVSNYLHDLLKDENIGKRKYDNNYIENQPYLRNIAKGLAFIKGYLKQLPTEQIKPFGNYIYRNVLLIKNTAPASTDLNKLFSTINSSGVQLEQTDIIKANLLKRIDNKVMYAKIWEACEDMNNFIERNAKAIFHASDWQNIDMVKGISFSPDKFMFEKEKTDNNFNDDKNKTFSIDTINLEEIGNYTHPRKHFLDEENRESEEIYCRSIINFGQLLLHTYRLHLKIEEKDDFQGTFHVNRLIEIFRNLEEVEDPGEIKRFFELLWRVRFLFDKYIIKWVSDIDNKSETLELTNIYKNEKNSYNRTPYSKSASLMLQSVLYFTGDYLRQYWLGTYLDYLYYHHGDENATDKKHLAYLEKIDNVFSLNTEKTDKELSWMMMHQTSNFTKNINIEEYLSSNHGVSFKHYWFQKLEYVLWKNWEYDNSEEFKNYRIVSKNSVEHIYPQHPENIIQNPPIENQYLHSFGNLVLLSVSQNSEYSNKSVPLKRSMFKEKMHTYDSLKSYRIFQYSNWSVNEINDHRDQMISILKKHYKNA